MSEWCAIIYLSTKGTPMNELDPDVMELFELAQAGEISYSEVMADLDIMGFDGDIVDYL
jgi:hypothetical protein